MSAWRPENVGAGGLIKHVAATERGWIDTVLQRTGRPREDAESDYTANFRLQPGETLAEVLDRYETVAKETEAAGRQAPPPRHGEPRRRGCIGIPDVRLDCVLF